MYLCVTPCHHFDQHLQWSFVWCSIHFWDFFFKPSTTRKSQRWQLWMCSHWSWDFRKWIDCAKDYWQLLFIVELADKTLYWIVNILYGNYFSLDFEIIKAKFIHWHLVGLALVLTLPPLMVPPNSDPYYFHRPHHQWLSSGVWLYVCVYVCLVYVRGCVFVCLSVHVFSLGISIFVCMCVCFKVCVL